MSYVPIKGGGKAIKSAEAAMDSLRCEQGSSGEPLSVDSIERQLRLLHSRVLSEGGFYSPKLASLAIKQSMGDTLEAAFALRAYRSTKPRLLETPLIDTSKMRFIRRISAAFKDIQGGQSLGPTSDYSLRMMRMELLDENKESFERVARDWLNRIDAQLIENESCSSFEKVLTLLREEGLLPPLNNKDAIAPFDITREPLEFPAPRSAALATMARAETGSMLGIAYSNMRGYGDIHPTVAELRVGYVPVLLPHEITGEPVEIGEFLMTECEIIAMFDAPGDNAAPVFSLGYGACFGHNEVKSIAMAILDRSLQTGRDHGPENPSEDEEFVLLHIDGTDSMGFCTHYKMPHYVTFQSDMDRLRSTQIKSKEVFEGE